MTTSLMKKGSRVGLIGIALPVLFAAFLGVLANWPVDCGPGGCGEDSLAGSASVAALFGVSLATGLVAVGFAGTGKAKPALVLLAVSAVLVVIGIL